MASSTTNPSNAGMLDRRARMNKTAAYYSAFIALGLATAYLGPTLPGLAKHVHSTIQQISSLFVASSLGYMLGSIMGGRLYDRVPGHPLLVSVVLLSALVMFVIPIVPLLWVLAVVLFIQGMASGMLDVGINTLLVWVHRDEMGPFMNGLHFFFGIGTFVSPIIIAQAVLLSGDIYWAYWALGLIMLPAIILLIRLPSPKPIVTTGSAPLQPALPLLIALLSLFDFCYVGSEVSFGGWIFTYATRLHFAPDSVAAYLTSGFWGAFTVGRLISIPLAAKFPARRILLVDLLLAMVGLLIIQLIPGSYVALWAGTLVVGLGMASIFPTVIALAESFMTITSWVTSWLFVGSSLGAMAMPWIIGQLFDSVGPFVTMISISTGLVLDLVLWVFMTAYEKRLEKSRVTSLG
ncbi:MAG TPA: MFS transporter [Anaerolineaceae bacterium]